MHLFQNIIWINKSSQLRAKIKLQELELDSASPKMRMICTKLRQTTCVQLLF
jgi:hypothetical protein